MEKALEPLGSDRSALLATDDEPDYCRTVRAELEEVMQKLRKLLADCRRGLDKHGNPRPSRLKWLWKKNKVDELRDIARQAKQDLQIVLSGHMLFVQQ